MLFICGSLIFHRFFSMKNPIREISAGAGASWSAMKEIYTRVEDKGVSIESYEFNVTCFEVETGKPQQELLNLHSRWKRVQNSP
ncbi:hypothetical protein DMENIID0001_110760 [Sergentomyia squamirostris]